MKNGLRVWSYPGIYPYPEGEDPTTGIFIHKQNLALASLGAELKVVLPVEDYPVWPFYLFFKSWKKNQANTRPLHRFLNGIEVFHPRVASPKPSRIFRLPGTERKIRTLIKFLKSKGVEKGKDVLLAQWLIPDGYVAVRAAKELGIACAVEMQGDDIQVWPFKSENHKRLALYVLENADLMLGCSDFLCQEAKKLYGKPLETHTIYTGIDAEKFKPCSSADERKKIRKKYGVREEEIMILNVGSAIARKGWIELFTSASTLIREFPNIKFVAASGGLKEFDLRSKAAEYGIENHFNDLGSIPNHELSDLYQAADIFCLPSHWEGLANVLCEAMASGCAIITTAVSGHPEVIMPEYNGELVPPKDPLLLTEALRKVIASPELRKKYGKNARVTAVEKIASHEANAQKLLDLLQKTA